MKHFKNLCQFKKSQINIPPCMYFIKEVKKTIATEKKNDYKFRQEVLLRMILILLLGNTPQYRPNLQFMNKKMIQQ